MQDKIEEMATIMCGRNIDCETCECRKGFCFYLNGANKLSKHYQQKISEDQVIISKKEYEEYQDLFKNFDNYLFEYRKFADARIKESKSEAAEKILNDLEEILAEGLGVGFYRWHVEDYLKDYFEKNYNLKTISHFDKHNPLEV